MSGNDVKTRQAQAIWGAIKSAAQARGDLTSGMARVALALWGAQDAGTKLSADRAHREAFVASLIGAAAVDTVIDKLAEDGTINTPDAEYLRGLNAEAALRDLSQFQKTADVFRTVAKFIATNPVAVTTVAGAVAGAGFGAYADPEDRLRGAVRFGIPGAVTAGVLAHGMAQDHANSFRQVQEERERALKASRDAERAALQHKLDMRDLKSKLHNW